MSNNKNKLPAATILLETYFTALRIDNWSIGTIDRRRHSLGQFITWFRERGIGNVDSLNPEILEAYRRHLYHRGHVRTGKRLKFATQASYLSAIAHFLGWLTDKGMLDVNPAKDMRLPKEEHRLPASYLSLSEVETLLNTTDVSTPSGLRDRAILEMFYSTGLRRSEGVALQLYDIDHERRLVTVRQGKGRKDRIVPIGVRAIQWIEKYVADGRPALQREPTDTLFLTNIGRRFHPVVLSGLVRSYLDKAGIKKRGSCHMLRHTTATLMLEQGADLRSLQTLLGHEQLNTTQIYTHVTIQRLREVHDKTHPARPDQVPEPSVSKTSDAIASDQRSN